MAATVASICVGSERLILGVRPPPRLLSPPNLKSGDDEMERDQEILGTRATRPVHVVW
jgi:hypothetical protein